MFLIEYVLCGMNIACHLNTVRSQMRPKYPPDVEQLCYYFEDQKSPLPEYCKWQDEPSPPKRRNEF